MTSITNTLQSAYSPNLGADLIVVQCGWDRGADIDDVIAGRVPVSHYIATSDGRGYFQGEWHSGPTADAAYVERVEHGEVVFHGWIDSVSRRLVQAG